MTAAAPNTLEYEPLVRSLVSRYRGAGALPGVLGHDDLAQQARLDLLELARRWEPERGYFPGFAISHLGWALGRYVKRCDPNRRSARVRIDTTDTGALEVADQVDHERDWASRMDCRAILDQLTPEHRSLLWWHYAERHTQSEIARVLGITTAEAEARIKRAMRAARAIVEGRRPRDDEADITTLLEALREGAGICGRLPGRSWVCKRSGLSELRMSRLMGVLVERGLVVGRGPRCAGYLAERGGGKAA